MKRILCSVIFVAMLLVVCNVSFGQAAPGEYKPYMNRAKWFATQSAPTGYEKAQWALDDINAYRRSRGLEAFDESILSTKIKQPRFRLFSKIFRGR